ncbi:DUF2777 family protein [Salibacterium salarium]|uniref:DUF2777 family protein n=1 Tax=Salibacterium salarium TaxID=284579 RepID=A0A3R9QMS9_9BACI|nr:DUF2777 family protein [Salibacterium salarium]RSL33756.1 DUF2777 family protein [Salibacterium salarium]
MKRLEATKNIGNTVLVNIGSEGIYYGTLEEVFTPPKKIWSGQVFILGVAEAPDIEKADTIKQKKDSSIVVTGSKITLPDKTWNMDFNTSVIAAIQTLIDDFDEKINDYTQLISKWKEIGSYYGETYESDVTTPEHGHKDQYVYYYIDKKDGHPFLYEPTYGDELELEGCPFEFEIHKSGKWINVSHDHGFTFKDEKGKSYSLHQNETIRVHQEQFQPFTILLNELEHPARKSILEDIEVLGFTRDDLLHCHNRLLYELLQSEGSSSFKGVNFLTFQKSGRTLIVQHHYERILKAESQDYVYDRFEYTTDNGERRISTYTSAYSKDHES